MRLFFIRGIIPEINANRYTKMETKKPVVIDQPDFLILLESGNWKGFKGNVLSGVELKGLDLSEIDLSGCVLFDCTFTSCNFHNANLSGLHTGNSGASFIDCNLHSVNFASADLSNLSFLGCTILACEMSNADLSSSQIIGSRLITCNLRGVNMVKSDLTGTVLQNNDLYDTIGNGAQLKSILCAQWPITYTFAELQFASLRSASTNPAGIRESALLSVHGQSSVDTWRRWKNLIGSVILHEPAVMFPEEPFLPVRFKGTPISETLSGLKVSQEDGFFFVAPPQEEGEE